MTTTQERLEAILFTNGGHGPEVKREAFRQLFFLHTGQKPSAVEALRDAVRVWNLLPDSASKEDHITVGSNVADKAALLVARLTHSTEEASG